MRQLSAVNTAQLLAEHIGKGGVSGGTETSKYPEEKKSTEIPQVVANERGRAQTVVTEWTRVLCSYGVGRRCWGARGPPKEIETEP